jgi:hypothetical protein
MKIIVLLISFSIKPKWSIILTCIVERGVGGGLLPLQTVIPLYATFKLCLPFVYTPYFPLHVTET